MKISIKKNEKMYYNNNMTINSLGDCHEKQLYY
jgi:hypothetical protein